VWRVFYLLQKLKFTNKFLGYLTGHLLGAPTVLTHKCIDFLCYVMLCDWYLAIIRPYMYSLLGAHIQVYWFLCYVMLCDWYLAIIRPYMYSLLGAHIQVYWFLCYVMLCDWYLAIIRPYMYSLLPENTIYSGRFIVDTLYIFRDFKEREIQLPPIPSL
jgi:hypothetical protein